MVVMLLPVAYSEAEVCQFQSTYATKSFQIKAPSLNSTMMILNTLPDNIFAETLPSCPSVTVTDGNAYSKQI
jgi:hypothetical protein